jgi:predicted PurR-regulated permease PerM
LAANTGQEVPERSIEPVLLTAIFLILLTGALRLGAGLLLPIVIACLFALLLDHPVRALRKRGVPSAIGAAAVVFGTMGILVFSGARLSGPAIKWVEGAPNTLRQAQARIRQITRPIQRAADRVEQATESTSAGQPPTVQIKPPGLLQRISSSTAQIVATTITIVFLTYFLLATLPVFRAKVAKLIGTRSGARNMEELLTEIEVQMSRYIVINTLTSIGVGLATWGFLAVVGLPNALLLGVVALLLNFIPYAGPVVTTAVVGLAALVALDDTGRVLIAMGGVAAINMLEGNLVTPHLIGKTMPLNPVAIFVSLIYWGWVWGPVGTLLAVPITVMLQVIFSRVERLRPVAVLLDR